LYTETDESDLGYFTCHQLATIESAVDGLRNYIARKTRDHRAAEKLLKPGSRLGARLNHRQRELLLHALRHPGEVYSIAEHQHSHQVTYQTARSDLLALVDEGLMRLEKRRRAFLFSPVADLEKRMNR
jgi:Fic family protein